MTDSRAPSAFAPNPSAVRRAAVFVTAYVALQLAWIAQSNGAFERWLIESAEVRTSVALIGILSPQIAVSASGASIVAPGGGVNVRSGCEGTEILFPLLAGLLAYPFSFALRVYGMVASCAFVFGVNEVRLLGLFYAYRSDPALFGELHGFVTPLLFVLLALAFFTALITWDRRRCK